MDTIEIIFTWGVPLLIVFLVFRTRRAHHELNDVFKTLARETGGRLSRSTDVRFPILSVDYQGCRFTLTNGLAGGGKVWVTKLYLDNRFDQTFRLRIQPTDPAEEFSKKFGFQDVELGNVEFDKQYLVKTPDLSRAQAIVDLELQQLLVDLRPLRPELLITDKYIFVSTQMQHELNGYRNLLKLGHKLCELQRKYRVGEGNTSRMMTP